jgi:hypothetical protein
MSAGDEYKPALCVDLALLDRLRALCAELNALVGDAAALDHLVREVVYLIESPEPDPMSVDLKVPPMWSRFSSAEGNRPARAPVHDDGVARCRRALSAGGIRTRASGAGPRNLGGIDTASFKLQGSTSPSSMLDRE